MRLQHVNRLTQYKTLVTSQLLSTLVFKKSDIVNKTQLISHEFRLCLLGYKVLHKNEKS